MAYLEIQERVTAVVSVAGAVGGSPLADEVADPYLELLRRIPLAACPPGDGRGVESLRRSTRLQWLSQHELPRSARYFSLVAFSDAEGISAILRDGYHKLARIDYLVQTEDRRSAIKNPGEMRVLDTEGLLGLKD